MQIKYVDEHQLKRQIVSAISKHLLLKKYKIFLFGSRVRGDNFPRSDVDIGIEGPVAISAEVKIALEEELDNLSTLYTFELVDFRNVSEKFRDEALKYTEQLN